MKCSLAALGVCLRTRVAAAIVGALALLAGSPVVASAQPLSNDTAANLGTYSIGRVEVPLFASGGTGAYTWSLPGGDPLPTGISIRTDKPSWFPSGASAGLIGIATAPGTYAFTLRVSDGNTFADRLVTLRITGLAVKTPWSLSDASVGIPYSLSLEAISPNGSSFSWAANGAMPPGLSLAADGTLSGTPTADGFFSVPFSVTDGTDTIFWTLNITVYAVDISTNALLPAATVNQPYSTTVDASSPSGGVTLSASGLPSGLMLAGNTISGTPNQQGRWTFTLTATDAANHTHWKSMTLWVTPQPVQLPGVTPYGSRFDDCTIGVNCVRGLGNWFGGAPPFTWSATGLPNGMSIRWGSGVSDSWLTPGDAEIYGVPTVTGFFNVSVTVTDAGGRSATNTFPLHVSGLQVTDLLPNGQLGVAYSQGFRIIGGSGAYTTTMTGGSLPQGLAVSGAGVVSGTPQESGWFYPTWAFSDGAGEILNQSSNLFIASAGDPSVNIQISTTDLGIVGLNSFFSRQLFSCCVAVAWSLDGGALPAGVSLASSGVLSGTPTAVGTFTFTVRATDASNVANYARRQLTLVVSPVSIVSSFALPSGNANTFYSYQLQASGGIGGYIWSLAPGSYLPSGLTLTSGGLLSGVPSVSGQFQFRVNVTDTLGNPQVAYLALSLYPFGQQAPVSIQNFPTFGTFSIGDVQFSLTAQGGNGTYLWSVISGSLPPGLSLRTDGPPWFPATASAGIIGIATTPGTYNFTLRVTSGSSTAELPATMTITSFTLKDWSLPEAFQNQPYSYTLTPINAPGSVSWSATFGLPPGLSLDPATGVISGTPSTPGFYNISVQATSGGVSIFRNLSVSVFAIKLSTSTPLAGGAEGELPNATNGQPYTATIVASGGSGTYTYSTSGLPFGLSLNAQTGVISGTFNGIGRFFVFATATDTNAVSYSRSFIIHAAATPAVLPLVSVGDRLADCTLGLPCSRGIFASNGVVAPLTWSVSGLPAGMSSRPSSNNPGDIEIWGVPVELGDFQVSVTATDATNAQGTNIFPLHVSELELTSFLPNAPYGQPYSQKLRVIGGTPGYAASIVNASPFSRLPETVTLDGATQTVSGTPIETGFFSPDLVFADNASPTPHTLHLRMGLFVPGPGTSTIQINSGSDLGTRFAGLPLSTTVFACCLSSVTWSVVSGTTPAGFTITPQPGGNGQISTGSTPLTAGVYTFLLKVQNAGDPNNFAVRQFTLTVTTLSFPPGFPFSLPFGNVGSPYNQTLTINGASPAGSAVWSLGPYSAMPPGLTLGSNGTISGTPTVSGQFQFLVNVVDGSGSRQTASLSLAIYPAGQVPPLNFNLPSTFNVPLGTFTPGLSATGGVGPYHFALAPNAPAVPGMRVQDGPPLPNGFTSPTTGAILAVFETPGTYTTTIRATDSAAQVVDRTVTFNVSPLLFLSPAQLPKATINSPYSYTLAAIGATGSLTWSATNLPPGITIVSNTGQLQGTPVSSGNFFPSITISDQGGHSLTTFLTLVVDPFSITNGSLPAGTQNQPYSVQFTQSGCPGTCTWTASLTPPMGLTFTASGLLSGTPIGPFNGLFPVQVSNGTTTVSRVFALVINPAALQALTISGPSTIGPTTIGTSVQTVLAATGGTRPYSWSIDSGSLPPGVILTSDASTVSSSLTPGFGLLYGKPAQTGTYTFTLRVTDAANESIARAYTWIVSGLNFQYTFLPISGSTLTKGTPYSQALLVIGGTSQYTWAGTAPAGLVLDSATGVVAGTPLDSGFVSAPITVSDTGGRTLTNTVTFNIAAGTGPGVGFAAFPIQGPFLQGQTATINLFPSGGTPPYTVTALSPLPPGFTLVSGDAILSTGTPPNSYVLTGTPYVAGSFPVTLQLQDNAGHVSQRNFTINVSPIVMLTNAGLLSGNALPDGSVNAPYSQQLVALDAAGPVVFAPGSPLPAGLTLSPSGLLSGTPTTAATYTFAVSVTDVASGIAVIPGSYTLKISAMAISAPAILPTATSLQPYSFTFGITGAPGAVTFSAAGLPNGLTLSPAGVLSGTPTGGGTLFQVTVTATSGAQSITRRVSLYVRPTNLFPPTLPLLQTALPDAGVGQLYTFTLNPSGGLAPYAWSVPAGSQLPPGLSLVSGAQLPPSVFPGFTMIAGQATTPGLYTFDLLLTDSQPVQTRRTFTLRVSSLTILAGLLRNATAGQPYAQQLTAVGGTAPYAFSIAPLPSTPTQPTLPAGITFSSSGLFSGTTAVTGVYSSLVTVQDAAGNAFSRIVRLNVMNANGLQVTTGNPGDIYVGGGMRQNLFTNGSSTYAWSLVGGALPPGVALAPDQDDPSSWSITGQPGVAGIYSYTLRATDTANALNAADRAFTFNVSPMQIVSPPATILAGDLPPAHVGVAYSAAIKVAGGTPPYTFAVSPATPLPLGLSLSANGILSGTPTQNGGGSIAVVVTDAAGATLHAFPLTIFINPAGVPPAMTTIPNTPLVGNASVGVPYRFPLTIQRAGVAPFSWTLAPGSSLPPGLAIVRGSGAVPDYLAGAPTTAGRYEFSLVVADASGQTAATPFTLDVSPLALTPNEIPRGRVGVPYSVSLVASGGIGPYTLGALADWDMPPGLTLTGATLSGTPSHAGSWLVMLRVTDSASPANVLSELFEITIDNAAGEAPAIAFGQRSIQITYVQGSPAPLPSAVSVTTTSVPVSFDVRIGGVPGATLSATTGTTPATLSLDVHATSLAAGSYFGVLALKAAGAANVGDAIPVLVTVLTPPPCGYTLTPSSASALATGGTGTFSLDTGSTCSWTATSSDSWITVTSPPSGNGFIQTTTGPATVHYSVAANGGVAQRSGSIVAGGQTFSITQFGSACSFAISPLALSAPAAGGTAPVNIVASGASCAWTASGLGVSPASGTGSATVTVTIPANTLPGSRTLTATIAGKTFTVNQSGIDCAVTLSPLSAAFGDAGGSGSFAVTTAAACGYSTTSSPNWVTINSGGSGTGPGTLVFTVAANSATTPRTGSIIVGGQSFSISQAAAACSVTLDTSALTGPFAVGGGSVSIGVTANGGNCAWTASSPVNWASVAPNGSSGSGSVTITAALNPAVGARNAALTIAGQSVTISQGGQACSYSLQSSSGTAPAAGGSGAVGVVTAPSCAWTAVSNDPGWLTASPGGSSGAGDVTFTAAVNPGPVPRTGTLTVAGLTFTVTQAGAACSYTLPATAATIAGEGATGQTFSLSGAAACAPAPVSYANWITIDQTSFAGGTGTVTYTVLPNPLSAARTGVIQIADQTFTVTQTIAQSACRYSLHAYGALFNRGGGGGDVFGSGIDTSCNPAPTIGTDQPSFISLGPLQGPVLDVFTQPFTVAPFGTPLVAVTRRGSITFGGQIFIVKQVSW